MHLTEQSQIDLLEKAGYRKQRANYMGLVLRCAVETLKHAEEKLSANWSNFCNKKGAIRRPRKAAKDGRSRVDENAVTYELADYIDEYLMSLPADHSFRMVKFEFERPKTSAKLSGSHQKRLDMRFRAYVLGGPEFVIEAKPLHEQKDVGERYLGEEGLGRFVRECEPLTKETLGALLGYVPLKDLEKWRIEIRNATATKEGCEHMEDIDLSPWDATYSSRHVRSWTPPSGPLWILHLLVKHPQPSTPTMVI
jgi:hypothetical protein